MAVGVFGGTFDPIHMGHLRVAEEVRETFNLETVYFVPVYKPPHKRGQDITGVGDRLNMIRSAIRGNVSFRCSEIEVRRGGLSYSIDTIMAFEKRFGTVFFLMGIDAFSDIETWHRYGELFSHCHFIVMVRPMEKPISGARLFPRAIRGLFTKTDGSSFQHESGKKVHLLRITQLDVSSTRIRDAVTRGRSIRYIVPSSVERYIRKKGLYRNRAGVTD
jgi:nicotinate-nucleotide adenylyltransferase